MTLSAVATPPAQAAAPYAGRAVADVLAEIDGHGVRLIYSSDIVPPSLRIDVEPRAQEGVALAVEILAAHGLELRHVGTDTWAVVVAPVVAPWRPAPSPQVEDGRTLEAVEVTASRYLLAADVPGAHTFLTQAQIEQLPKMADEVLRAVHRLPGMASNGLSGLAHVRGGEESESAILVDGFPLYEPFHLRNFWSPVSVLDSRIVDSLDVYTGGYGARYGERMSGIVDVRTRRAPDDAYGELGASLFHANALGAGRFGDGRGEFFASVRQSWIAEVAELATSEIGEPSYTDGFGRVSFEFAPGWRASLSTLLARDRMRITEEAESANASYSNRYVWAALERTGEGLDARLLASYTRVASGRDGSVDDPGLRSGTVVDERRYRAFGLKLDAGFTTGRWTNSFGAEARALRAHYEYAGRATFAADYPFPGTAGRSFERVVERDPHGHQYSAWASTRTEPARGLTVELGARFESQGYTDLRESHSFDPRVNLRYTPVRGLRLQAAWGRFHQAQGINELQVEDGVEEFQPSQRADHAVLGFELDLPRALTLRVEAYRKRYRHPRVRYENQFNPLALLPELQADRVRIAPTSARARGIEWLLSHNPEGGAWRWWLGYSLASVEDRIDGVDVRRSWDQRHALSGGLTWTGERWDFALGAIAHSGWPTTRVTPAADFATTGAVVVAARNGARLDEFTSVDLRASRRFPLPHGELRAWVELTNALNQGNVCCHEYSVAGSAGTGYTLERETHHWARLVPSLGVLWVF